MEIGADSGGTFTDVVGSDGRILKILSTPEDPGRAVRGGVEQVHSGPRRLCHGTTVATNALLERGGAEVVLYTTEGLTDVVEIGRQHRPSLYDPWVDRTEPLVCRDDRVGVEERLGADGSVLRPVRVDGLLAPRDGAAAAVCLLHADLHPEHERRVATHLRELGAEVSASHEVAPELREYERTVTTVVNASLRPVCRPYLRGLADMAEQVAVMTSAGGLVDVATASELPVALLLSGPAGGVRAASAVASAAGFPDAITFDMGGTSTDVALVLGGEPAPASMREVAGLPILAPSLDIHTIGAGGGSIAGVDPGGALVVGPRSAGAVPGPACYGRGGSEPTVTDANLVLGRLRHGTRLPGVGELDLAAARLAIEGAGAEPMGIIQVVNAGMEQALRTVSVERGVDPAGLALVAFGGAGPLHACELADAVGIGTVLVPVAAGVLSAVGLLAAPMRRDLVRSWDGPAEQDQLDAAGAILADRAAALVAAEADVDPDEVHTDVSVDCRYRGQTHVLRVASLEAFTEAHLRMNGYVREGDPVEVTAVRAVAEVPSPVDLSRVLSDVVVHVAPLVGPSASAREDCAIWVPEGWHGTPGPLGTLVLERG